MDFKTIGITVAENTTSEYRLPESVTNALISAVNNDGRVKITDPERAETVLEVTATGYSRAPYEYTGQEQVTQYKISITAKAKLRTPAGKVLWESSTVNGWSTYQAVEADEEGAIKKAAENLAAEIIRQAFETW